MGKLDNDNSEFPDHTREYEGLIPYFWCEENDIVVNPEYHYVNGDSQWRIGITIKGKRNLDPKIYDKKDIMEKVYKYCEYYYKVFKKFHKFKVIFFFSILFNKFFVVSNATNLPLLIIPIRSHIS